MQRSRTAGAVASGNPAGVSLSDSLSGVPGHCVSLLDGLSQGAESGLVTAGGPGLSYSSAGASAEFCLWSGVGAASCGGAGFCLCVWGAATFCGCVCGVLTQLLVGRRVRLRVLGLLMWVLPPRRVLVRAEGCRGLCPLRISV